MLQGVSVCLSSAIIRCYCPNGHYSVLGKHCRHVFHGPERSACPKTTCLCALVNVLLHHVNIACQLGGPVRTLTVFFYIKGATSNCP